MAAARPRVIVIGAGAAGLAAARALRDADVACVILEARDRIGGRVFTQRVAGIQEPIELGAEFVHGRAEELASILRDAGLSTVDISGSRRTSARGRLRPLDDFWERLDRVMRRLPSAPRRDRSFHEFLAARPGGASLAAERRLARRYVEGFHAADPRLVSASALAGSGSPGDDERERRLARILDGYDSVIAWLAAPLWDCIRLSAEVTRVAWARGRVRIDLRTPDDHPSLSIDARAAIVTVPLGVLKTPPTERGGIAFDPTLAEKAHVLDRLAMGSAIRVTLRFNDRFWASDAFARRMHDDALDTISFIHSADRDFPVWWTAYPLQQPIVVGWCGGVRARELSMLPGGEIERRAVAALARVCGLSAARLRSMLAGVWMHDWEHDPFARGAYSYQMVGGADAPAELARPLQKTLFFAGEAADAEGSTGTVHGAIASGRRAAAQVLRVL